MRLHTHRSIPLLLSLLTLTTLLLLAPGPNSAQSGSGWKYLKCNLKADSDNSPVCSLAPPLAIKFASRSLMDCTHFCDTFNRANPADDITSEALKNALLMIYSAGNSISYLAKIRYSFPAYKAIQESQRVLLFAGFSFITETSPPCDLSYVSPSVMDISKIACVSFNYERTRQMCAIYGWVDDLAVSRNVTKINSFFSGIMNGSLYPNKLYNKKVLPKNYVEGDSSCALYQKTVLPKQNCFFTEHVDCDNVLMTSEDDEGIRYIKMQNSKFPLDCKLTEDGKPALVILKRTSGSISFNQAWNFYLMGFGDVATNYFIGLQNLAYLLSSRSYSLHVQLEAFDGDTAWVTYGYFSVGDYPLYRFKVGEYSGTAGDSLQSSNAAVFMASDYNSNPLNCTGRTQSSWWFVACFDANLHGVYRDDGVAVGDLGIIWSHFKGRNVSLKKATMSIFRN